MIYLYNNYLKKISIIGKDDLREFATTEELNSQWIVEISYPFSLHKKEAEYVGFKDNNEFKIYKIINTSRSDDFIDINGVHIFFHDLKGNVIRDIRPSNKTALQVATEILKDTGWQVFSTARGLNSTNFYHISKLDAFYELLEKWQCEFRLETYINGDKFIKKIYLEDHISKDYGRWFEYGDKLSTVVAEENHSNVFTAFIGRGKGEETGDGYSRKIKFDTINWSVKNGNPIDKIGGQDYVEIKEATKLYGYPDGKPRIAVVDFDDEEDRENLLKLTYEYALENSRPKLQLKATAVDDKKVELGEVCAIIRPDLDIRYKTRIFKVKTDRLSDLQEFEFGDKIVISRSDRIRAEQKTKEKDFQEIESRLEQAVKNVEFNFNNEDGYNYDLKAGNKYNLPAGIYSFDKPIDENPTKLVYVGAGKVLISNKKGTDGAWIWQTAITGDGIAGSTLTTNSVTANKLAADVGQSLDLSSNTSIRQTVENNVSNYLEDNIASYLEDNKSLLLSENIDSIAIEYASSDSDTTRPTSGWSEDFNSVKNLSDDKSIWRRLKVTKTNGEVTYTGYELINSYVNDIKELSHTFKGYQELTDKKINQGLEEVRVSVKDIRKDVSYLEGSGKNYISTADINPSMATIDTKQYAKDGTVTVTSESGYGGICFAGALFNPNTTYILSFSYQKTSGKLESFGGHTDASFKNNRLKVDGKVVNEKWISGSSGFVADDTEKHYIELVFTTPNEVGADERLCIQPNRGSHTPVSVKIEELQIREGEKVLPWIQATSDIATRNEILEYETKVSSIDQDINSIKSTVSSTKRNLITITDRLNNAEKKVTDAENNIKELDKLSENLNSLSTGGYNLISNGKGDNTSDYTLWGSSKISTDGKRLAVTRTTGSGFTGLQTTPFKVEEGRTYTIAFDFWSDADVNLLSYNYLMKSVGANSRIDNVKIEDSQNEHRYSLTFTAPFSDEEARVMLATNISEGQELYFKNIMITESTIPSSFGLSEKELMSESNNAVQDLYENVVSGVLNDLNKNSADLQEKADIKAIEDLNQKLLELIEHNSLKITQTNNSYTQEYSQIRGIIEENRVELEKLVGLIRSGIDDEGNTFTEWAGNDENKVKVSSNGIDIISNDQEVMRFKDGEAYAKALYVTETIGYGNHIAQKYGTKYTIFSPNSEV